MLELILRLEKRNGCFASALWRMTAIVNAEKL